MTRGPMTRGPMTRGPMTRGPIDTQSEAGYLPVLASAMTCLAGVSCCNCPLCYLRAGAEAAGVSDAAWVPSPGSVLASGLDGALHTPETPDTKDPEPGRRACSGRSSSATSSGTSPVPAATPLLEGDASFCASCPKTARGTQLFPRCQAAN